MSLGPIGMNTGMDINSMVSKIVDAERAPKQQRISNLRAQNNASISAYGRLKESLNTMKDLMSSFRHDKAFAMRKVDSSDDHVVTAKATTDAIAGKYSIDVLQLAQSHKVASAPLAEDTKFGKGKLQISLGDSSFTVNVQNYSKLKDVVNSINYAKDNPGIRASVIKDKEGPRLILASNRTGKDYQIQVSAEAEKDNPLKKLEYKTLEQRVKDIENARAQAQELIHPLTPEEQQLAAKVAEKMEKAARVVDESVADEIKKATQSVNQDKRLAAEKSDELNSGEQVAAADEARKTNPYVKPEDRIPGWTETASGTLLDSYQEPEPELDDKATNKSKQVPGWSNTASGTLYDSYVTPEEAETTLKQKLKHVESVIDTAAKNGDMSFEDAKNAAKAQMTPEERAYFEKVEKVKADLENARDNFKYYQGMSEVQAGQDSQVLMDGVATLSSDNNIIDNAVEGVDITLKGESKDKPTDIGVEYDRDSVRKNIESFVNAYNQFYTLSKQLSSVDPATGEKGPLAGDSVVRSADSRLKRVFSTEIDGAPANMKTLTEFGITTTRAGNLEINDEMLSRQLNNNFDKLGQFFGGRNGFAVQVENAIQGMTGVTGSIRSREKTLSDQNYRLDTDQSTLDRRMDALEKRTHAKFEAMQDATGKMQSQLTGMMNSLGSA